VKRCTKGKSCGATCIDARERCNLELGPLVSPAVGKASLTLGALFNQGLAAGKKEDKAPSLPPDLKAQLAALGGAPAPMAPRQLSQSPGGARMRPAGTEKEVLDDISRILRGEGPANMAVSSGPGSATGNTKWARIDAKDHDNDLGKVRREGDKSYDGWKDSYGSGASKIGEGSYGTVIRNPDGTFVKRGDIADTEAALIKRLGDRDLGPKLIAADINGPAKYHQENFVNVRNGRIAMGQVPGNPMGDVNPDTKIAGKPVADIYWTAMAGLHRLGVAHNDAHIENILIDKTGKGRWVDLGLAQSSPKAALAEALGSFSSTIQNANPAKFVPSEAAGQVNRAPGGGFKAGNWQARGWDATGVKLFEEMNRAGQGSKFRDAYPVLGRVADNKMQVQRDLLGKYGLTRDEVAALSVHGIRSPLSTYNEGPWAKLTDKQAQELLDTLYDGI
jgi:hypothetical protein